MKRVERLRQIMTEIEVDAFLVTDLLNIRYLSNFTGTTAMLVITADDAVFITDGRYTQQASQQAKGYTIRQNLIPILEEVADYLTEAQIDSVAIEASDMNVMNYITIQDLFEAEIVETVGIIEDLRKIKDADELATIQKACDITDQAFSHILDFIEIGMSEIEIANELERFHKAHGASSMSFTSIIASGLRSSMPHGVASEKLIEAGDLITMDFGCYYQGYCSDMTRTIAVRSIDPELETIYNVVLGAHNKVIEETKAGMSAAEMDAIARDYIDQAGYGEYFTHSTGHGLGLNVHEAPAISARSEDILEENMVVTDEPGIYIDGLGGVRIEDDLVVTKDGVYSLNKSPKDLIILDI